MIELFGFLEHVLAKHAVVEAGGRDRAHVVKASCADGRCKLDGMARAIDVGGLLIVSRRLQIVDCREVEKMIDLPLEPADVGGADAEVGLGQVAHDRDDLPVVDAPRSRNSARRSSEPSLTSA